MTKTECPNCGKMIYGQVDKCPDCGCDLKNLNQTTSNYPPNLPYTPKSSSGTRTLCIIIGIVTLCCGIYFMYKGFDVKNNYTNIDDYSLYENAYVGGDAYNYIINGTYFIGYMVLSIGFYLIGLILILFGGRKNKI